MSEIYLIACSFCYGFVSCTVCTHEIEIGRVLLPLIANMLFVSKNFSLEKVFVRFSAVVDSSCCVIYIPYCTVSFLYTWLLYSREPVF